MRLTILAALIAAIALSASAFAEEGDLKLLKRSRVEKDGKFEPFLRPQAGPRNRPRSSSATCGMPITV